VVEAQVGEGTAMPILTLIWHFGSLALPLPSILESHHYTEVSTVMRRPKIGATRFGFDTPDRRALIEL
jgi:hypothetical protein